MSAVICLSNKPSCLTQNIITDLWVPGILTICTSKTCLLNFKFDIIEMGKNKKCFFTSGFGKTLRKEEWLSQVSVFYFVTV